MAMKTANNGAQYEGPDYYQPDPSQPNYQPNSDLPWASAPAPTTAETPTPAGPPTIPDIPQPIGDGTTDGGTGGSNNPTDGGGTQQSGGPATKTDTPPVAPPAPPVSPPTDIGGLLPADPWATQQAEVLKTAPNGATYTGPDYYQPDPSQPDYQPNSALPWKPAGPAPTPPAPTPPPSFIPPPPNDINGVIPTPAPIHGPGGVDPDLLAALLRSLSTAPTTAMIDPMNDLRSQAIDAGPSARTTAAQASTDKAAAALTGNTTKLTADQTAAAEKDLGVSPDAVSGANAQVKTALGKLSETDRQALVDRLVQQYRDQAAPDARLTGLQGQVDSAAKDLAGVDRFKLATDKFSTYADETDPAFQATLRSIMDREVGAGGFSGRLNTSYGDAGLQRERDLRNERSNLFNKALEDSVQDAFGKESALSGLEGQLSAEDLSRFSTAANLGTTNASADMGALESTLAGARGVAGDLTASERAAQSVGQSRAQQQLDTERSDLGTKAGLEGQSFSEDSAMQDRMRSERDYEVGQEGEAYQRAVAQHQQEQQDEMAAFEREMQLLGAGEAGNPAGEIGALSTQINPGLDLAALVQLAQSAGASSGARSGTGVRTAGPAGIDWESFLSRLHQQPGVQQSNQQPSMADV